MTRKPRQCKAGMILPTLTKNQHHLLITTIAREGYVAAANAMQAEGIDLAEYNIRRHTSGFCACGDYQLRG